MPSADESRWIIRRVRRMQLGRYATNLPQYTRFLLVSAIAPSSINLLHSKSTFMAKPRLFYDNILTNHVEAIIILPGRFFCEWFLHSFLLSFCVISCWTCCVLVNNFSVLFVLQTRRLLLVFTIRSSMYDSILTWHGSLIVEVTAHRIRVLRVWRRLISVYLLYFTGNQL